MNIKDRVQKVVDDLVNNQALFTALDVSNAVKVADPLARHREVRELVRSMYANMVNSGYGRTPIQVTLSDGSQVEALLYHPLFDSWDLDTKYDAQKRKQSVVDDNANVAVSTKSAAFTSTPAGVTISSNVPVAISAPAVSVVPNTPVTIIDPKQLWDSLFTGVKLFPRS